MNVQDRRFRFESYSESGLDERLTTGYFGTTAESITDDEAWIIALRKAEETLVEKFPTAGIGLYYGMDEGKKYAARVEDEFQVAEVLAFLMTYRNANEPSAAIMLDLPAPVPVSRLVFGQQKAAIDHDALFWCIVRAKALGLSLFGNQTLALHFGLTDLLTSFPWIEVHRGCKLGCHEFWRKVYSGEGFGKAETSDGEVAQEAASRFDVLPTSIEFLENFYASPRIPEHRLLKIEVSKAFFDALLIDRVASILKDFQTGWAVRFAVYEQLLGGSTYMGSVICDRNGVLFIEVKEPSQV